MGYHLLIPIAPKHGPSLAELRGKRFRKHRKWCHMYTNYDIIRTPPMTSHRVRKRFLPNSDAKHRWVVMISSNPCLLIGSCSFNIGGVIIIRSSTLFTQTHFGGMSYNLIVTYQYLFYALYLTLYFSKLWGVTIIWNSTCSMPWDVPIDWNMSSNWHQRVQ